MPLAREAFAAALKDAGLAEGDVDHAIVTGLHVRAVRAAAAGLGVRDGVLAPDLTGAVGNLGAAQAGVALCDVLERAEPGQVIVVLSLADGADALVLRTTDALAAAQRARAEAGVPSVAEQVAAGRDDLPYATFLTWRGQLRREPPRRPDPERPGAPTVHRSEEWKYAFAAQPVPRVRLPPHAPDPGLPVLPRHRPDAARAPGRRPGHGRHLHRRPPGLQPLAAGRGRHRRLRRRRPLPLRDDRRRRVGAGHRRPGRP